MEIDIPPGLNCFEAACQEQAANVLCLDGLHIDKLATFLAFCEHHYAVNERKESVVLAEAHIEAGVMHCAALTLDDVTCFAALSAENLYTESFAF